FIEQKDFVWGLIASMYLGNIAGLIVVLTCVPLFAAILRVPFSTIAPCILVICAVGADTVHNSMFDVWMMLAFGVMGDAFTNLGLRPRWRASEAVAVRLPRGHRRRRRSYSPLPSGRGGEKPADDGADAHRQQGRRSGRGGVPRGQEGQRRCPQHQLHAVQAVH